MCTKHEGELTTARNPGGSPAALTTSFPASSCTNAISALRSTQEGRSLGRNRHRKKVIRSHQSTMSLMTANQTRAYARLWATGLLSGTATLCREG